MWFLIIFGVLFIAYLIFMQRTKKLRETIFELQQEEKNIPIKKPNPVKIYSRGHVTNEVKSLYYKPDSGYLAIGGLVPHDKKLFKMCVFDYNKKERYWICN